jgi:hypothetical protein
MSAPSAAEKKKDSRSFFSQSLHFIQGVRGSGSGENPILKQKDNACVFSCPIDWTG